MYVQVQVQVQVFTCAPLDREVKGPEGPSVHDVQDKGLGKGPPGGVLEVMEDLQGDGGSIRCSPARQQRMYLAWGPLPGWSSSRR